ncbi:MAG: CpaF family protein [Anaerolineaceae bacterium]|nr:CpaF family protein [Anaerolineaceae bacterium]
MYTQNQQILSALGPLAEIYNHPDVLEIMVDSPDQVLVERAGQLVDSGVKLASSAEILQLIDALLALTGEKADPGETILSIAFPASEARGMAVLPPTALQGPCLVIRKLMNSGALTWEKLIEYNSVTRELVDFLSQSVNAGVNILIAGGTGSGKTTVANRIAELIPPQARLVVAEASHELQIKHPRAVFLEANRQRGVTIHDLIHTASKIRPDWLICGEMLGSEAMLAVEKLGRGYSGMTTIHANSPEDALARLEAMCLTANIGLGLAEIRGLIAGAIRCITYQQRMPDGRRKVTEVAELLGLDNGRYVLNRLFRYNPEIDRLESTGTVASWIS